MITNPILVGDRDLNDYEYFFGGPDFSDIISTKTLFSCFKGSSIIVPF